MHINYGARKSLDTLLSSKKTLGQYDGNCWKPQVCMDMQGAQNHPRPYFLIKPGINSSYGTFVIICSGD